ncbi:hypothetical protein KY385_03105 [Candidatus Parcubacteria bacterium]|nr:hypothetical protein [Candidatus Parcubacteria bacterium]
MNNGRAVHFEDHETFRRMTKRCLKLSSDKRHEVVGEAADLAGAFAVLHEIETGNLKANVVILDGNLTSGTTTGEDARKITQYINDRNIPVRVVGMGGRAMKEVGVEVDVDITKEGLEKNYEALADALNNLEEPNDPPA